jgi:hypothetical protein
VSGIVLVPSDPIYSVDIILFPPEVFQYDCENVIMGSNKRTVAIDIKLMLFILV